jgi:hypothetical protein
MSEDKWVRDASEQILSALGPVVEALETLRIM